MRRVVPLIAIGMFLLTGLFVYRLAVRDVAEPHATAYSVRPLYHLSVPDGWKNDPQRPIYLDGKYHYYYLYNRDYPSGNGTAWRHAVSDDLVHWEDEGVAIPKYTSKNGDIWSGSVVVDKANTAGFGTGALLAIVTQPSANGGKQEQYVWYSLDQGRTFHSYRSIPVLANPGVKDFRDPKVIWDPEGHWVMALAEGDKVGFYESSDFISWQYTGSFKIDRLGLVECPDLFQLRADDGTVKWVLGVSANGKASDQPNTFAYWSGEYQGGTFEPDTMDAQWLDYGFDWYGAVTFEDGAAIDPYRHRFALAWMNNWDYPHVTPARKEGFNGMDSIVRQITLKRGDGRSYRLVSQPIDALNRIARPAESFDRLVVNGSRTLSVSGEVYQMEADISWTSLRNVGLRLRESEDGQRHIDAGLFVEGGYSYVNRSFAAQPDVSRRFLESRAPYDAGQKRVHVRILVDKASIEMFVDDGMVVHSSVVFPARMDRGISLYTEGGTAVFTNVVIRSFES